MIREVSNHPVHLFDKEGQASPSAFIPFCAFGKNMSTLGFMNDNFELPICNSFQPKFINHHLCYAVDLHKKYKDRKNIEKDLRKGLVFLMDYNEDRQLEEKILTHPNKDFVGKIDRFGMEEKAFIYLDTIGNKNPLNNKILTQIKDSFCRASKVGRRRKIQYGYCERDQSNRIIS